MKYSKNFALMCENISLDASQKITLVNVFDRFHFTELPAFHPRVYFVANIRVSDIEETSTSLNAALTILDPHGEVVVDPIIIEVSIRSGISEQNIGVVFELRNFKLPEAGNYTVQIMYNTEEVAVIAFDVSREE